MKSVAKDATTVRTCQYVSIAMNPFRLELSSSVRVNAPLEVVWRVFADVAKWTDWCGVCVAANVDEGFDWEPGQRIALRFRMAGVSLPFNVAITEAEPAKRIAWASTKLSVTAVRTFSFAEEPEAGQRPVTIITDHKLFTSPVLPLKLFYPRPVIRRMTEAMLADLKDTCEMAGTP